MDHTTWRGAASNLANSNFLKHYNAFPKQRVTSSNFSSYLDPCILREFNKAPRNYTNAEKCVWLWTLDGYIYKSINKAIFTDNDKELEMWMPVIRGINCYLIQRGNEAYTVYRASNLSPLQVQAFVVGRIIRIGMYAAGSLGAITIFKERPVTMVFHVPEGCYNARDISHLSACGKLEKEILFPPYTACKVISVVQTSDEKYEIHVEVLDNLEVERKEKSGEILHFWEDTHEGGDLGLPCDQAQLQFQELNAIQRASIGAIAEATRGTVTPGALPTPCSARGGIGVLRLAAFLYAPIAVTLLSGAIYLYANYVSSSSSPPPLASRKSSRKSSRESSRKCRVKWGGCSC